MTKDAMMTKNAAISRYRYDVYGNERSDLVTCACALNALADRVQMARAALNAVELNAVEFMSLDRSASIVCGVRDELEDASSLLSEASRLLEQIDA